MTNKCKVKTKNLTSNIKYIIMDRTLYLLLKKINICKIERLYLKRKIKSLIINNEIAYINISGQNLEKYKHEFNDVGFTMSYYDVNKLNLIYKGKKNKKEYRCYALITKKDYYINMMESITPLLGTSGYISNIVLLLLGIIMLCCFSCLGAINLIK